MKTRILKYLKTLLIVVPMSTIMSFVAIARSYGFRENWGSRMFDSWSVMAPIAFFSALLIIPAVNRLFIKIEKTK